MFSFLFFNVWFLINPVPLFQVITGLLKPVEALMGTNIPLRLPRSYYAVAVLVKHVTLPDVLAVTEH